MPHPYPCAPTRGCLPGHAHQKILPEVPSLSWLEPAPCPRSSFVERHFPRCASKPSGAFLAFSLCSSPSFHTTLSTTLSRPHPPALSTAVCLLWHKGFVKELAFETNTNSSSLSQADKSLCTRWPGVRALIQPCQFWSQCGQHQLVHPSQVTPGPICSHQRAFTPLGQLS